MNYSHQSTLQTQGPPSYVLNILFQRGNTNILSDWGWREQRFGLLVTVLQKICSTDLFCFTGGCFSVLLPHVFKRLWKQLLKKNTNYHACVTESIEQVPSSSLLSHVTDTVLSISCFTAFHPIASCLSAVQIRDNYGALWIFARKKDILTHSALQCSLLITYISQSDLSNCFIFYSFGLQMTNMRVVKYQKEGCIL